MLASFCGTCGLQFQSNDTFCARCGTPRDTDVSETTALQVPAPNTPTVLSSNPQTFCIKCGQPHSANVFPCPFCNSSVPTIQTQMPIATQMATDVPTPPLIIKNPTPKQIFAAMVSDANPYGYGAWGKLVINGNTKNPWDFPFRKNSSSSPDITHAGLLTTIIGNGEAHIMPNVRCQDFVYQAAITFPNGFGIGGLAFRIDVVGDECYYCGLNRSSPNKETVYVTLRSLDPRIIQTETLLDSKTDNKVRNRERSMRLLTVVVQGTTLDVYVDLVHIARTDLPFVNGGSIGIWDCSAHLKSLTKFRHTQLWVKNP